MASPDLARRAFASMTKTPEGDGGGEPSAPKAAAPDAASVAGKRFGEAVKGGNGAAIAAAFRTLKSECEGGMEDDDAE